MRYYATLFDKNYLSRGKVMLQSLQDQTHNQSVLFVLALDQTAAELAAKWPNTRIVQIHDLEAFFPNLLEAKANRSFVSYIFTLSPFLPLYILQKHPEISRITTLDADLLFLNSPEKVLESLGDEKIGITQHGFPEEQKHKEIYGKYNVSFQSFPNTQNGLACLQSWAEDCLDFCGDYIDEKGRFADQKYLDFWSEKFHHVVDFPPTIGLAPWNLKEQQLQQTNKKWQTKAGAPVFYHFHHFRIKNNHKIATGLYLFGYSNHNDATRKLYKLYWKQLTQTNASNDAGISRIASASHISWRSLFVEFTQETAYLKIGKIMVSINLMNMINPFLNLYRKLNGKHHLA